ncbi:hypothetical protein VF21_09178 [Pseudogymnoascus sp. 05NY08]|nr:hypothetical protein VF21_09178 [Pseudogymnoascus sp. 05NY08]
MAYTEAPDSLRIVLIVLTTFSFLPQIYHLWSKKDSTGISIGYVLANLLVATEQLSLEAYVTVNVPESAGGTFTHNPLSTGDWLNFVQTLVTWLLFLVLFSLCLHLSPGHNSRPYINIYALFLLISLVPEAIDLVGGTPNSTSWPRQDYQQTFAFFHAILINPLLALLSGFSFFLQAAQTYHHYHHGTQSALSLWGLAAQTVVFTLVAVSWVWRVVYAKAWDPLFGDDSFLSWYFNYGHPVVANGVFAAVQGGLLLFAGYWRRRRGDEVKVGSGETEALLGQ